MRMRRSPDSDDAVVIESPKGQVIFHNVKFSYQEGTTLIEDPNMTSKRGRQLPLWDLRALVKLPLSTC